MLLTKSSHCLAQEMLRHQLGDLFACAVANSQHRRAGWQRDTKRRFTLTNLEVAHETPPGCSRHDDKDEKEMNGSVVSRDELNLVPA